MTNREDAGAIQAGPIALVPNHPRASLWRRLFSLRWMERNAVLAEVLEIRGLMPLLMKRRNGTQWTSEEQLLLRRQLRALIHCIPWLVILVLPGSALFIPLFAWWLDRRRHSRRGAKGRG
jgi:hypothetical protein